MRKRIERNCVFAFTLNLTLAFLVFLPFLIRNGGLFTLSNDFDAQELAFNMFANRSVKSGQIYFNWAIDMGSDFTSSFSFYNLGSPFFWISLLFPASFFPYLVSWLFMLKYAAAGLTSYLYLSRYVKDKKYGVVGSVLYAFCGYQAANMVFYHFHDVVAFFPLLLLGLDYLTDTGKRGRFALAVFINALVNWNFFVGEVLFLILYFIIRFSVVQALAQRCFKWVYSRICACIAEGILGVSMAAVLFIPSVAAMLSNTRISNHLSGADGLAFSSTDYLQFIKALLFPNETLCNQSVLDPSNWYSVAAYLPAVGVSLVLTYLFIRKDWVGRLLTISLVIALVPVLNNSFVMFNVEPYRRWYYMPILIMVLASVRMMEEMPFNKYIRKTALKCAAAVLFSCIVFFLYVCLFRWSQERPNAVNNPFVFGLYFTVGIAGIFVTFFLIRYLWKHKNYYIFMLSAVCLFGYANMTMNIVKYQRGADFPSAAAVYHDVLQTAKDLPSDIIPYRYALDDAYYNRNMANSLTSIDSFISTIDNGIFEFYDAVRSHRHTSTPDGPDGTMELLSVKYFITPEERKYTEPQKVIDNGYRLFYVYENPYALPMGFTYDSYITRSEFETLGNDVLSLAMLHTLVVPDDDAVTVSQALKHDDIDYISVLSKETKAWIVENRKSESAEMFHHSTTGFTATIRADAGKYAFFSVPYHERWSATVNGEAVKILNINGLMAVLLKQGDNDIVFSYSIILNQISFLISLISAVITLSLFMPKIGSKNKRRT